MIKNLIITLAFVAGAQSASAACTDYWGHQVYVQHVAKNVISLKFSTGKYPASGYLKYSGERSTSYYFRGNGNTVEMQKTVADSGVGAIWYHYTDSSAGDHGRSEVVRFNCN